VAIEQKPRRYPRVKVHKEILVAWKNGSQKYVSRAEDLGLGGLFVRTQNPPVVGTSLQLLFNTPEGEVRVRAVVRSLVVGRGMGLGIVAMDQEHRTRLDRWLKKLAVEVQPITPHT
jgi:hypothetical protein